MLTPQNIQKVVLAALQEDSPSGDITSEVLIPAAARAEAQLVARESGILSGAAVFEAAMHAADADIQVTLHAADGDRFSPGEVLATVVGSARGVLRAERVALNLVQRMSGIATLTNLYVAAVAGTRARIVDTRKTTPGLRALERHAVTSGGGHNHRFSLSDAVLAKDNHLAIITQQGGLTITEAILAARAQLSHTTHLEVEVDRMDQIEPVLAGGVDTIMLDNFSPDELRAGVALVAGRALVEASGGVNLDTVKAIAEAGVDIISVGALTHSVRALDLGLDIAVAAESAVKAAPAASASASAPILVPNS